MKDRSEDEKISFIQRTFDMKTEIMLRYYPPTRKTGTSVNKITDLFQYNNNSASTSSTNDDSTGTAANNQIYRRWLYIEENIFYCSYCVCFGDVFFGVDYTKDLLASSGVNGSNFDNRLTQHVKRHEAKSDHKCISKFVEKLCTSQRSEVSINLARALPSQYNPSKRNAVECIIKVIIHLATHCKFLLSCILYYSLKYIIFKRFVCQIKIYIIFSKCIPWSNT